MHAHTLDAGAAESVRGAWAASQQAVLGHERDVEQGLRTPRFSRDTRSTLPPCSALRVELTISCRVLYCRYTVLPAHLPCSRRAAACQPPPRLTSLVGQVSRHVCPERLLFSSFESWGPPWHREAALRVQSTAEQSCYGSLKGCMGRCRSMHGGSRWQHARTACSFQIKSGDCFSQCTLGPWPGRRYWQSR